MKKLVDVSGFGNTGKSFAFQLIESAFKSNSLHPETEFEFFRAPGGLFDLYISCVLFWSPIRCNKAIKDFKLLNKRISTFTSKDNLFNFFTSTGNNYNKIINSRFQDLGERFISDITEMQFKSDWPYDYLTSSSYKLVASKVLNKLNLNSKDSVEFSESSNEIKKKFENYIHDILNLFSEDNNSFVLLANSVEPYGSKLMKKMYNNFSQVIVDRDPRDVFTTLLPNKGFKPDFLKNKYAEKALLNTVGLDVDVFIKKYRLTHDQYYKSESFNKADTYRFEEIVSEPNVFIKSISEKIAFEISADFNSEKFEKSKMNIGIYKDYKDSYVINKIQDNLTEYCYL